jgi:hypothetical protein
MKIGNEEVELVTDFASLRAGIVVWCKPCRWCGGQHRGMLLRFKISGSACLPEGGRSVNEPRFDVEPMSPCSFSGSSLSARSVEAGVIYRVVDPLLDAAPVTRAKELAR